MSPTLQRLINLLLFTVAIAIIHQMQTVHPPQAAAPGAAVVASLPPN
jgi:hypothetical protein